MSDDGADARLVNAGDILKWAAGLVRAVADPALARDLDAEVAEPVRLIALQMRDAAYAIQDARRVAPVETHDSWAVIVECNGEQVVTIASNCLGGRDLSPEDEATIRLAATHLLSFVGPARDTLDARRVAPLDPLREQIQALIGKLKTPRRHIVADAMPRKTYHDGRADERFSIAVQLETLLGEAQRIPAPPDAKNQE